jgi:hypothetical protein
MSGLGKYKRTMYIWNTVDGFYVQAGCFFDKPEVFKNQVIKKYGGSSAYLKAVDFLTSDWK